MENMKLEKRAYILLSLIQFLLGGYLFIRPGHSLALVCYATGIVLIVYGVIKLIGYFTKDRYNLAFQFDLAMGLISVIIGFIFLFRQNRIMRLLPTFIGVLVLINGIFKIQTALDAKRFGLRKWWLILILAIATGTIGLILMIHPVESTWMVIQLIGLNLMIDSILNLWVVLYTVKE